MAPKFLFNKTTTATPNVNKGIIFKEWQERHGREYNMLIELDLEFLAKNLNVSEAQAKETATKVVESIWRLKNDRL